MDCSGNLLLHDAGVGLLRQGEVKGAQRCDWEGEVGQVAHLGMKSKVNHLYLKMENGLPGSSCRARSDP